MPDTVFLKDDEWSAIDGQVCRVKDFRPMMATVEDGVVVAKDRSIPYAAIDFECAELAEDATGFITHRDDFRHLWSAINERGVGEDEEVLVFWTRQYPSWWARRTSKGLPKLVVWICQRGAYELLSDRNAAPELSGEARHRASAPLAQWMPDVLA